MTNLLRLAAALLLACIALAGPARAIAQATGLPAEIAEKEWVLVALQRAPGDTVDTDGKGITLLLAADGSASGSDGCNRLLARYDAPAAGQLTITPGGTTMAACPPEVMALATEYTQALAAVRGYSLPVPGMLELAYGDQGILRFAVAATSSPPVTLPSTGGAADLAGVVLVLALALALGGLAVRRRGVGV